MKMKIVNYNLLNGVCHEEKPFNLDKKRLFLVAKVLEKENPDILILTEAYLWPFAKKDKLNNYPDLFDNLCNLYAPAQNQFRWAPVVFSRFPTEFTDFSEFHKTFLRIIINIEKRKIFLDVIHPHPEFSEQEKEELANKILKNHQTPYILAGDLNSLSPQDNYNYPNLLEGYRKFMKEKAEQKIEDMSSCLFVKSILKNGLIDSFRTNHEEFDFTVPTNLRSKNKDSAVRIDYIFCSKQFKIVESGIIKDKLTEQASDHYPIYAVLEI